MSDPLMTMRWVYSPVDQRWHLLPEAGPGPEARCGQRLPRGAESHREPYGLKCPSCAATFRTVVDPQAQRGRLWVPCHHLDTGRHNTLLLTQECDGAWTLHTTTVVRIDATTMASACQAVLQHTVSDRHTLSTRWYLSPDDHGDGPIAHTGLLHRNSVHTTCGLQFPPQATLPGPPAQGQACPECEAQQALRWHLRSVANHDTHYGTLAPNGVVASLCGLHFSPRPRQLSRVVLPPDPDQACCLDCRTAAHQ